MTDGSSPPTTSADATVRRSLTGLSLWRRRTSRSRDHERWWRSAFRFRRRGARCLPGVRVGARPFAGASRLAIQILVNRRHKVLSRAYPHRRSHGLVHAGGRARSAVRPAAARLPARRGQPELRAYSGDCRVHRQPGPDRQLVLPADVPADRHQRVRRDGRARCSERSCGGRGDRLRGAALPLLSGRVTAAAVRLLLGSDNGLPVHLSAPGAAAVRPRRSPPPPAWMGQRANRGNAGVLRDHRLLGALLRCLRSRPACQRRRDPGGDEAIRTGFAGPLMRGGDRPGRRRQSRSRSHLPGRAWLQRAPQA